ncbi:hypothetical protein [Bacillus cereus]|uniref:hypothetical protein n=1 Tax=Bacillus cereus TaxID=1396 RepID=UPI0015CF750E|nr:hypothetical protein [Bacillus cereus]
MTLSIQEELQPFAEELQRYIKPVFLKELATEISLTEKHFLYEIPLKVLLPLCC